MIKVLPTLKIFIFIFFFVSCNRSAVKLENTNASGEVPRLGNLSFRFSNALIADSLLNKWDSVEYISFKPSIPGRFRWERPDELIFSPLHPLPPATEFIARFNPAVVAHSKFGKVEQADPIRFFTADLTLEDHHTTWVVGDDQSGRAIPQVDLYFNYPVSPEELKKKLKIEIDKQPAAYALQTLSADSRISLKLPGITPQDKDIEVTIVVAEGLLPQGGNRATSKDMRIAARIPSPFNLSINDVSAEHDGVGGRVTVRTSQQVLTSGLSSSVHIVPAVRFSVEPSDEGFVIKSDAFDADKSYVVTLNKGIRGNVGGVLQEQYDHNITFGELEPSLRFMTSKSVYLSSKGSQLIEMRIINVPRIKVVVSKIYESNLLAVQRYGYYPKDNWSADEEENYYADESEAHVNGDVIYEQEIDTRSLPQVGNSRLYKFNTEDKLADFKGIYHIRIRSVKDYWVSDSRFIAVSDLGLIAKEARNKLLVFTNSIRTAGPVSGVNIIAYGINNQVLGMAATNAEGVAEIAYTRKEFAGFKPGMIVAKTANDFNYLPFNKTRVNTSRFETGGKRSNTTGLDAFLYAERDIYRPGETLNFSLIVRDRVWKVPGELPLKFRFLLPNGKELKAFRKTLNSAGSTEGNLEISNAAITGTYTLEVYTSNDVLLANKNFSIEEFVPDRIKVTAKVDQPFLVPGQSAKLSINAVNFFGPPAANRNYEAEIQTKAKNFSAKKYDRYDFSIHNQGLSLDKVVKQGRTDAQGNATEVYEIPQMFRNSGLLQANFYATVFDETGRPVSRSVSAEIFTQPVFFGIAQDDNWYYPLNQPALFGLIAMDKDQRLLTGAKAVVKIIRHEYRTVVSRAGSYFRYESQESDKLLSEQTVTVSGESTVYHFVPRTPGNYEIRISLQGASGYISKKFYSYGSFGGDNNSFEVNQEGNIDIETDKSVYNAGETAKVLFKAPFNGKMLVTMESDQVISYQYVTVEKRNVSVDMKVSPDHLPNVFITATLLRPHGLSDIPLTVAHGYQNVKVQEPTRINKVQITAAREARSKTRQQVTVKTTPGSYVTLAAVDNGVLQVTDFKTPDPYNYFYASRALEVDAFNVYPFLFPELRARLSSTGGDAEMDMQKRVNPMPAKRINILSYWSGIRQANGNGEAKFSVDIPPFSGQIRLMAVAYKGAAFGSAESAMTVADPLVLSSSVPRFLSPGDTISVPVTITNTTSKNAEAVAGLKVSGPVQVIGSSRQNLLIKANTEARAIFSVVASEKADTGRIIAQAEAFGEKFAEEIAIGIRPASPLVVATGSGSIAGGKTERLEISGKDFIPGSSKYKLVISKNPLLEAGAPLNYLLQYPFGCTEQVVSAAFPQLYYADLSRPLAGKNGTQQTGNENVLEAIRVLKLRQLYNGAVTLWEGESSEHWWSTIYACHFLFEARKAGFDVDESLLNGMLNYINSRLRNKQTIVYYYNRTENKRIAPKEIAYGLYVLALASQPNIAAMNYYKANPALLSLDGKYLLSAAYAISGDKKRFRELLPASFSGEVSARQTGGSFYSPIRDEAIALNVLIDIDPANSQVPLMARHVFDQLKQQNWYGTQEAVFSVLALGKLSRESSGSTVTADITAQGKKLAAFTGQTITLDSKALAESAITIETKGQGKLYYFWQREGISASGQYREEDNYIKVRRSFFDRYGRKIAGSQFKQNELVIVQVVLENLLGGDVENIVITDILPAGFEIENPRTREIPGMEWIKDAAVPSQLDIRDDRLHLFVDLRRRSQVYYYAVRAVSPGYYTMGPIAADAMYNGEYHSYHGGGKVRVVE